jgi:hypothetical protein
MIEKEQGRLGTKKFSEVFGCCQEQHSQVINVCALWASLVFGFGSDGFVFFILFAGLKL